ncbi:MAG: hypothetical protein PHW74_10515 [Desulfobacca sp.]|nr:hypothetical protein [Desulfobacca sp.]
MLCIDRLRLHLPAGYQDRAPLIARQVAAELSQLSWEKSIRRERLTVPALNIMPGWSDQQIAQHIAAAVHRQVNLTQR